MAEEEALLMSSLVLILAISFVKEKEFRSEDAIYVSLSLLGTELVEGDACGMGTWYGRTAG